MDLMSRDSWTGSSTVSDPRIRSLRAVLSRLSTGKLWADMSCDKPGFVVLLLDPCSSSVAALLAGDMNADGVVDGRDVQLFVDGLLSG